MNFELQSEEMKNTILHASIGEVALEASALEYLSALLFDLLNDNGSSDKKPTLGRVIRNLKPLTSFSKEEIEVLDRAVNARNDYAHRLPSIYIKHITSQGNMRTLIEEMISIKFVIAKATDVVKAQLEVTCCKLGTSFEEVSEEAQERYNNWKDT